MPDGVVADPGIPTMAPPTAVPRINLGPGRSMTWMIGRRGAMTTPLPRRPPLPAGAFALGASLGGGVGMFGFAPPCPWVAFQTDKAGLDSAFPAFGPFPLKAPSSNEPSERAKRAALPGFDSRETEEPAGFGGGPSTGFMMFAIRLDGPTGC